MIELPGKYTTAYIMTDDIEGECVSQIYGFINHPAFTNHVAIMPDTHAGKGSVIGFTVTYPTWLPEELQHHFIRGVFDGDGCVSIAYYKDDDNCKLKNAYVNILGTNDICSHIQRRLSASNIPSRMTDTNKTDKRIRTLWVTSRQNVANFGEWLYDDATIWLSRKKEKFDVLK